MGFPTRSTCELKQKHEVLTGCGAIYMRDMLVGKITRSRENLH